ncbi:MAG: TlpA family protein disulfide reductase [Candidatus Aminicenantes bacterium]|nr:TlpA family protein disulfide reductase [Candidatus Aminicenantes bacterium]
MKKGFLSFLIFILVWMGLPADELEVIQKAGELFAKKNFEEALIVIEDGIAEYGETRTLVEWQYKILMQMKRYNEALEAARIKDDLMTEKTPWDCLDIAKTYLNLQDYDNVYSWLDEAVERGFISYKDEVFSDFKVLEEQADYQELIDRIRTKIGIGQFASDFTVTLISGESFNLYDQENKVVLIDFWLSSSEPWLREIPVIKAFYAEYKDQGFEIIGICLDEDRNTMARIIEEKGIGWNIAFSGRGWDDDIADLYGVNSVPSFWLVDKAGILREYGLRGDELREAIQTLLREGQE